MMDGWQMDGRTEGEMDHPFRELEEEVSLNSEQAEPDSGGWVAACLEEKEDSFYLGVGRTETWGVWIALIFGEQS